MFEVIFTASFLWGGSLIPNVPVNIVEWHRKPFATERACLDFVKVNSPYALSVIAAHFDDASITLLTECRRMPARVKVRTISRDAKGAK